MVILIMCTFELNLNSSKAYNIDFNCVCMYTCSSIIYRLRRMRICEKPMPNIMTVYASFKPTTEQWRSSWKKLKIPMTCKYLLFKTSFLHIIICCPCCHLLLITVTVSRILIHKSLFQNSCSLCGLNCWIIFHCFGTKYICFFNHQISIWTYMLICMVKYFFSKTVSRT